MRRGYSQIIIPFVPQWRFTMRLELDNKETHLYLQVYHYYKDLILNEKLKAGSKMPSLRKCASALQISRTSVESAYLLLAADGYIISRARSGYYVTDLAKKTSSPIKNEKKAEPVIHFDFASSGVDKDSFHFDIWRRYIKSALRQDERLLSYGEPQGELELREVLSTYIHERRNVICTPDDIVIGAGIQSLLHILCPLLSDKKTVSFPNPSFLQGISIFEDHGFSIHYRDKNSDIIYVSPAHMTKWGEIMPTSRRIELIRYASEHNSIILEDDYENEFVYMQRPTPSLQSLAGGQNVVYLGSFSRLLLPSIRLSFMVLPPELTKRYQAQSKRYNQTASKMEQIALCQFIRDGHLVSQIRRLRRLYSGKLKELYQAVQTVFGEQANIRIGSAGISLALTLPCPISGEMFQNLALKNGVRIGILSESKEELELILSCSSSPSSDFLPGCQILYKIWQSSLHAQ